MSQTQTIKPTILFKRPETIDGTVEFPLPDGTTAKLRCKFLYRTRKEFGAFWDSVASDSLEKAAASVARPAEGGDASKFSFESMLTQGDEGNAESALRYLAGWPEDMPPLNKENLQQVFDEAPTAAPAFWEAYRALCITGRLGN